MEVAAPPLDLRSAQRRARGVAVAVLSGFGLVAGLRVADSRPTALVGVLCGLLVLGLICTQLVILTHPELTDRRACGIVVLQALITFGPLAVLGEAWIGMPGFLAGTLLLYARAWWGWVGFVAVVVATTTIELSFRSEGALLAYIAVSTTLTGLVTWALIRLTHALHQLDVAHQELARRAVVDERLRIGRDLHDALGSGLSAIVLKTEIAQRLVHRDASAAGAEMDETLTIARRAIAEVRAVADGAQALDVEDEVRAARSVLDAAGIAVDVTLSLRPTVARDATTLALALREAVTNVLRHSAATRCAITLTVDDDTASLTVVNDGCGRSVEASAGPGEERNGHGLDNLVRRFRERGGTFVAQRASDGTEFQIVGVLPVARPAAAAGRTDTSTDPSTGAVPALRRGLRRRARFPSPGAAVSAPERPR